MEGVGRLDHKRNKEKQKAQKKWMGVGGGKPKDIKEKQKAQSKMEGV